MRLKQIGGWAIIFGFVLTACKTQAPNSESQFISRTSIVVVATKTTDQAIHQATLVTMPRVTPTSTPPGGAAACDTANLTGTAEASDATGAITFTVLITNEGSTACILQGQPQIQIVNQQGEPLVLQGIPFCFECSPTGTPETTLTPGTQEAENQAATATASVVLKEPVILSSRKSARVFLTWQNWCPPFPEGGVNLLMTLPGGSGELTIPTDAHSGGRCDLPDAGSTLSISQFSPQ